MNEKLSEIGKEENEPPLATSYNETIKLFLFVERLGLLFW